MPRKILATLLIAAFVEEVQACLKAKSRLWSAFV